MKRILEQAEQYCRLLEYFHRNGTVPAAHATVARMLPSASVIELLTGDQTVSVSVAAAN